MGQKFQGLVRWATPVVRDGSITGYVTLALDHTHLMEFTDHVVPTEERYSAISDAASGNYAFMWDYKDRNISHPRDYFIIGYDPATGEPAVHWLEESAYAKYQKSDLSIAEFLKTLPKYDHQSLLKPSSKELAKKGLVGLDCRYLMKWGNLARHLIQWPTVYSLRSLNWKHPNHRLKTPMCR